MRILVAVLIFAVATVLRALDVAPFPTWYYVFAWYPTLIVVDTIASARDGRRSLFSSPRYAISLLGWSAVIWLLYEAINLRIANWYYVFLPPSLGWRWLGMLISFATVVPAVVLAERLLASLGFGMRWVPRPVTVRGGHMNFAVLLGVLLVALPLTWPRLFSPLVWGAALVLADPIVYRLRKADSLIADIEEGRWGRIGRLLLGGLAIGLWWETLNFWARGKWIYTVPFLEDVKLFEMPPFGFIGFPIFALSAWSLYHLLCAWRVAVPPAGATTLRPTRVATAALGAVAFSVATLATMEHRTISSTVPTLADLPGVQPSWLDALRELGIGSPFQLARRNATDILETGLAESTAAALVQTARLATLRGIGAAQVRTLHQAGIRSVCGLAAGDANRIWHAARSGVSQPSFRPTRAEIRVWIRAANRACDESR